MNIKNLANVRAISKLPLKLYPKAVKQKIRSYAAKKVKKSLIIKGKTREDISPLEYEYLVVEEEIKIWQSIKDRSIGVALMMIFGTTF